MASLAALQQCPTGLVPGFIKLANQVATDTLTAANSNNVIIVGVPTAAATYTTATAAAILANIGADAKVGTFFEIHLLNASAGANTITLAPGSGVTITGVATVVQNGYKKFLGYVTGVATPAITLYATGTIGSAVA
jgi:hypothetical protein